MAGFCDSNEPVTYIMEQVFIFPIYQQCRGVMPFRVSYAFQSGVYLSSTDRSVVMWLTIFCTVAINNKINEFVLLVCVLRM